MPSSTAASPKRALVTGCAGFLGSHLCETLLMRGLEVVGIDSFTDYYARSVKESNIAGARRRPRFTLHDADLLHAPLGELLDGVTTVYHLAAQPGVRPSFGRGLQRYLRDNVHATERLLSEAADRDLDAFVYASSSSVYGEQESYPAREEAALRPVSPYGATKVITEQLAGAYWRSAGVPVVGLRYFTVYGPRQRPDMAFARFIASALARRPLTVLGDGRQVREFTYVEDVIRATVAAAQTGERGSVYNVGGGVPVALIDAIELLSQLVGCPVQVEHRPSGPGDPRRTEASIARAARDLGYVPETPLERGLAAQVASIRAAQAARDDGPPSGDWSRASKRERRVTRADLRAHPSGPKVLAYSHDGYGLGHLRRNLRIVAGLRRKRPDVRVRMMTGARSAQQLVAPFRVECVPLPPVVKVANGHYVSDDGQRPFTDVLRARSALLTEQVRDFAPDLILVDRYPRGMHDELEAALALHTRERPQAPVVLGLRDILDEPEVIRDEWERNGYSEAIRAIYPRVLCYGDRSVYDPIREYALPSDIAERISFTGYLTDDLLAVGAHDIRRRHGISSPQLAVCTLGGGKDAAHVAGAFLEVMQALADAGWSGLLIAGPYMAADDLARLRDAARRAPVHVLRMVPDVPNYLASADVAVCMGGYNTVCELLALAVPAVVVPRVHPRQEQRMRAQRLGDRGLVTWLSPDQLTASALAGRITAAAAQPRSELVRRIATIEHRGIGHAAELLAAALPAPARSGDGAGSADHDWSEAYGVGS